MQIETEIVKKIEKKFGIVQVFVLNNANKMKAMGRSLCDWVLKASEKYLSKIIDLNDGRNIIDVIRESLSQVATHSIVLYSSTPLLTPLTIDKIAEYIVMKDVNACKLPVGFAVKNNYLKMSNDLQYDSVFAHCYDEFYNVENQMQLNKVSEILRNRIIEKHLNNGVNIVSPQTTTIDADVQICAGVDIFSHNTISGNSNIEKGVVLKENNVILNSQIKEGACIINSRIEDSKIGKNVYIKPYCVIKSSRINNNKIIESYSNILKNNKI